MTTSRDAARLAGVSQSTVSRVIRGGANVAPETRERVHAAIQESGYRPHAAATAMRTQRTGTIGVVVANMANPFYPAMLESLGDELHRHDLRMILWNAASGAGEDAALTAIEERRVDGVMFTTATAESVSLQRAVERRSPVVLVNRAVPDLACATVDSMNEAASALIAGYFAANGHERVGFVAGPKQASTSRDRQRGFTSGVRTHGLRLLDDHVVDGGFTHEGGAQALHRMFDGSQAPPTAVFCANDLSALGVLDAARQRGIAVPGELWVVGYDDIPLASWTAYELTTARQPVPEMARAAVELLVERIAAPWRPPEHRRFPGDIVVRRSTAHTALARPIDEEIDRWST